MTEPQDRKAIALFRYGLIADLIHLPAGSRGLYARLREKAAADYSIPGSNRIRVAPETLRHWLKAWRRGGFDALLPKGRADQGRSSVDPAADQRRRRLGARCRDAGPFDGPPAAQARRPDGQGRRQ